MLRRCMWNPMENVIVIPVKYFEKMRKKLNYLHKGCHEYGVFHLLHILLVHAVLKIFCE